VTDPRAAAAHTVLLRAMDTTVLLELSGAGAEWLEAEVRRTWSRCLLGPGGATHDVTVQVVLDPGPEHDAGAAGAALVSSDRAQVMDALSPRVTVAAIEHQAGRLMMIHACALADPATGRSIVMVGSSGTGKTTASMTLGRRFGYVTDEAVAIRDDGSIAVYPKPLSVIRDGMRFKEQVSVDALDLGATPERATVAGIVVLSRDGADAPWLEEITTVRALAMLATETSYLARVPRPLHRLADIVDAAGGLRVLHYTDAAQLVPVVDDLLASA
jgi:hypothetical protein